MRVGVAARAPEVREELRPARAGARARGRASRVAQPLDVRGQTTKRCLVVAAVSAPQEADCIDDSFGGSGDYGTDNFWSDPNLGFESDPIDLCMEFFPILI